ncbi:hypothetical protein CE91St56_23220 [Lachnospiraceae bacterium]|nr:hypothetical protein CE91St56_23220 [Lachnospiraceae bacterium]GKH41266.1 hypothetical protein CE91St57_22400 [Lachnospiraceae bacterium]
MKKAGLILGLLLVLGAGAFACGRAVQVHAAPAVHTYMWRLLMKGTV